MTFEQKSKFLKNPNLNYFQFIIFYSNKPLLVFFDLTKCFSLLSAVGCPTKEVSGQIAGSVSEYKNRLRGSRD